MSASLERIEAVFHQALEFGPDERAAFLAGACAGDAALLAKVQALLQAHETAEGFLPEEPRGEAPAGLVAEKVGDRIGHYKLLQQIGEGGTGIVYMAEQEQPVQRRVAFKIIKLGMDTKQVIARFGAERQALALMDHPNIAKVLDAGVTETGRPYFVMELVRGVRITDYCDQNHLPTRQRLDLFIQVCRAVQHAHQKGIIHRDIKPSNILVTVNDGVPVPKVIDFGIAKATQGPLTDKTLFTAFEQFIGTPAYMSPEQAVLTSVDIDTRSDIYSLGVLLYELLTGRTPFDTKELLAAGLDELRRTIREREPARPSTCLSSLAAAEQTTVAKRRQSELPQLIHQVRGDLDWIVMKCLEKDRTRRYETANGLANDIQRHLVSQPVAARPPSTVYRAQKFIRRHKVGLAMVAALVLLLAAGVVVSTWEAVRASRSAREAERQATRATRLAQDELRQRQRAESLAEENRQHLYAARINLAHQTFEQGDTARAVELLDSLRPQTGQADLRGFEWYYLWRLCHSARLNLVGHVAPVRSVAFSADGSMLATAGAEHVIRLWEARSGQEREGLEGHRGWVSSLAFSPDGKTLASGSADKTVRLWDAVHWKPLASLAGFVDEVTCVAFSPEGNLLAAASGEMATGSGTPLTSYVRPGRGGEVRVWRLPSRELAATFIAQTNGVMSLAFAPDGRRLATAGADATVGIWDCLSGKKVTGLTNFTGPVFCLAFSPDRTRLATGSWHPWRSEGEVRFWDVESWSEPTGSRLRCPPVACLAFAPDGKTLATGGIDQAVRLWDLATGSERASFKGHTREVWALAFTRDGRRLASGSWDRTIKFWDVDQRQAGDLLHDIPCYSLSFSGDGNVLACGGSDHIGVLDPVTGQRLFTVPLPGVSDIVVALSPDGKTLAAGGTSAVLHLFDVESHGLRHSLPGHKFNIWCLAFSPDGRLVATGSRDRTVRLWNAVKGEERATLAGHTEWVGRLAFTPDGNTLVSGNGKEILFWDVATGRQRESLAEAGERLAISPDGRMLAHATTATSIQLRDLRTKGVMGVVKGHREYINDVAFTPDGRTLATASLDGTTKLWRVPTGQLLLTVPSEWGVTWCAAFSPDLRVLALGSGSAREAQLKLLRAATKAEADAPPRNVPAVAVPKRRFPVPEDVLALSIQPRDAAATRAMLDLTRYYNGSLTEGWIPLSPGLNFRKLPRGTEEFAGVRFDVRGLIQLAGLTLNGYLGASYPLGVQGIAVQQKCQRLHFLHATGWRIGDGLGIGRYVIRYADGQSQEVPLVYGENVADWCHNPKTDQPPRRAVVAWTGDNNPLRGRGMVAQLYKFTWDNPRPDAVITSVDFASANTSSSPFLLAITAE